MRTTCPDCRDIPLQPISLLAPWALGYSTAAVRDVPELLFGIHVTDHWRIDGGVAAKLCPGCQRIFLFALPRPTEAEKTLAGSVSMAGTGGGEISEPKGKR